MIFLLLVFPRWKLKVSLISTDDVEFVDRVFIGYECYKYFILWNGYQQMFFCIEGCHIMKQTFDFHLMPMLDVILLLPGCDIKGPQLTGINLMPCATPLEFQAIYLSSRTRNESCAQRW